MRHFFSPGGQGGAGAWLCQLEEEHQLLEKEEGHQPDEVVTNPQISTASDESIGGTGKENIGLIMATPNTF